MKKNRFHYYEDDDTYKYIKKLPHWKGGEWVRNATRERMENDLKVIHIPSKNGLAQKTK